MKKRGADKVTPESMLKHIETLEKQLLDMTNKHVFENEDLVHFCAGRTYFTVRRSTIEQYPCSVLCVMLTSEINNNNRDDTYFIDWDASRFSLVIQYIQSGRPPSMTPSQEQNFKTDLEYFQIPYMAPLPKRGPRAWRLQVTA